MKELTKRQNEVLDVIKDQIQKTGMPPTRVEITGIPTAIASAITNPKASYFDGKIRAVERAI